MRIKVALFDVEINKICDLFTCTSEEKAIAKLTEINKAIGHEVIDFGFQTKGDLPIALIED